jgi:hypothetical protein
LWRWWLEGRNCANKQTLSVLFTTVYDKIRRLQVKEFRIVTSFSISSPLLIRVKRKGLAMFTGNLFLIDLIRAILRVLYRLDQANYMFDVGALEIYGCCIFLGFLKPRPVYVKILSNILCSFSPIYIYIYIYMRA